MFIELNDKDAYCAHENARNVRNVENIDAFMNMHQLKVTQIWDMKLNKYLRYWLLKALKSVSVTLYKLQMFQYIFDLNHVLMMFILLEFIETLLMNMINSRKFT